MVKHRKVKTKIVYRHIKPSEPQFNSSKVKDEIKELESRKLQIRADKLKSQEGKKGIGKFFAGFGGMAKAAAVNREINERRQTLRAVTGYEKAGEQTKLIRRRTDLEKAKTEFNEARRKNQVNFGSSGPIKQSDIFG
jgi:hypothetical protein